MKRLPSAATSLLGATLACLATGCSGDIHVDNPGVEEGLAAPEHFATLGGDFRLTDQDGDGFDLAKLRGKAALLFFGYSFCPDVCPLTLSRIALALDQLEEARDGEVTVLFVSVDPKRDTPQRLTEYLSYFEIPVIGLTGDLQQIKDVAAQYGATFEFSPTTTNAGYLVDHSSYIYLLDRQGRIRYLFKQSDSPERIAELLRQVLAEPSS